jgi:hypothetical protein
MFIREITSLKQSSLQPWLIIGDFNLIYKDEDKSNGRLNRNMMARFKKALDHLEVKEIPLVGKKFTWSNGQDPPTFSRIDRAFCSPVWEQHFSNPVLQALSLSISDHCPLILTPLNPPSLLPRFRFEAHWTYMSGFQECVMAAWDKHILEQHNPLARLHIKLARIAKALKVWAKTITSQYKVALAVCREAIGQFEAAQEN